MAKGENIFKRKDGRWEARYIRGYELSGKIRYGFCYGKTYREAKEKVTKCKADLLAGRPFQQSGIRHCFGYYCDEWLHNRKYTLKDSTYIKYDTMLNRHIKPKLGDCYPPGMTTELMERFKEELLIEQGLSPKTVKDVLVVLRSILNYTARQFDGAFPVIEISYPRESKKEKRILSLEEQTCFTEYLLKEMDECKFGILLALFTGMRIGELCALQWKNISLVDKCIRITCTMQRLRDLEADSGSKTKVVVGTPKSDSAIRIIPLTDCTAKLCRRMNPQNPAAFLLTGDSQYMEPRTLQYRLEKYTRECGLEGVHFHTLRHTFATRCVEVGFELKSLSEILGHSTTSITLNRYVHSSMELKRSNMNKLSVIGL